MLRNVIEGMKTQDQKYLEAVDLFLTIILEEESYELVKQVGIKYVVEQLSKGDRGRYKIRQAALLNV